MARLMPRRPDRSWFERIGGCDPALDADALSDLIERLRACQARISAIVA